MNAFRRVVEERNGQATEDKKLKDSVRRVVRNAVSSLSENSLPQGAVYRKFSSLQTKDIKYLMGPGVRVGRICYDDSRNHIDPPDFFLPQLDIFETTLTRDHETGNRVIIAHYLTHAMKLARKEFGLNRLVCCSEVDVTAEQIPDIGYLDGTLDFVIATMAGKGRVGIWALLSC